MARGAPSLTAERFEELLKPFLDRDLLYAQEGEYRITCSVFAPLGDALDRAGIQPDQVDFCLMVGGSSLIPQVMDAVRSYFKKGELLTFPDRESIQTAVARGAAYGDDAFVPSRPHHIRAFDLAVGGTLSGGRVFAVIDAGVPDGIRVDASGNVWTSAWDGVRVHAPDGTMILKIALPEMVSNLCFGAGHAWITATTSVYRIALA